MHKIDMRLRDHRACAEERADFHHTVKNHMAQGASQSKRRHDQNAKQNIRQIGDCRVGEPALDVRLRHRHA